MDWIYVASLITIGLLLLVVEILFVPGTTLVGLLGFMLVIGGVVLSFRTFGTETGWLTLAGASVLSGLAVFLSFRSGLWRRFSLKSVNNSTAVESQEGKVHAGEEGVALSSLRPVGKAEIGGEVVEVKTRGAYADAGTRIRVVQVAAAQIIVEPIEINQ
ncbi:MAG: NfeD family protein [Bacteroidota bacterium]